MSRYLRRSRKRNCTRKIRYDLFVEAEAARDETIKNCGPGLTELEVYWCQFCGGFHLGHSRS